MAIQAGFPRPPQTPQPCRPPERRAHGGRVISKKVEKPVNFSRRRELTLIDLIEAIAYLAIFFGVLAWIIYHHMGA